MGMSPAAYVSGTAGLALLVEGESAWARRVDRDGDWGVCNPDLAFRELAETGDARRIDGEVSRERVGAITLDEWRRDRALRNLLLALESEVDVDIRMEALEVVDEFLEVAPELSEDLLNVMCIAPLPASADLEISIAHGGAIGSAMADVRDWQRSIRRVRDAWDSLPDAAFPEGDKAARLPEVAAAGCFAILAAHLHSGDLDAGFKRCARLGIPDRSESDADELLTAWRAAVDRASDSPPHRQPPALQSVSDISYSVRTIPRSS